jgi:menaquinone-dependent protoporphyrinogen oxidase
MPPLELYSLAPDVLIREERNIIMDILIAVASRHGSTHEIGDVIAQELRGVGHAVDVRDVDGGSTVAHYGAAIVGSAIYMGTWLPEARQFVERNWAWLADVPVWLFSSGPLGQGDPQPHGDPAHLDALMQASHARAHRIFVGKLDPRGLGLGERLITRVVKAPEGDFRDWETIRAWAREIAGALPAPTAVGV